MVDIEQLEVRLSGTSVIQDVSLSVFEGEFICLLGPSGCGKTSMLRALAGFEIPTSGCVRVANEIVSDASRFVVPQKRDIGFLFQDLALFPHLTVEANIGYGLRRASSKIRQQRVVELLEKIGLYDHSKKHPHMLSGGEQQRVALARAMAPRPRLMLLDEPFSGLDASSRVRMREETVALLKDTGITTIMVTHDPAEAMLSADRIALMQTGRIVQIGQPETIFARPTNAFAAQFLGNVNQLAGVAEQGFVRTALGPFPSTQFDQGELVDVYIRPEAISTGTAGDAAYFMDVRVCGVQLAGPVNIAHLGFGGEDSHMHLEARFPRNFSARVGDTIRVGIDKKQTYFFKRDNQSR